jgi:predicted enzyme related to lactoylglutathione lyase
MLVRERYPAGVPCWVDTGQPDTAAARDFYQGVFGWKFTDRMPAGGPAHYYVAELEGASVAAIWGPPDPGAPVTWNTYIAVESVSDAAVEVAAAGGAVLVEPADAGDAGRMATVTDPNGAVFCLWQAGIHAGAEVVNAPGTWNWSNLRTDDPAAAAEFYGRVFGWEAKSIEMGEQTSTMFQQPGYAELLAIDDPAIRERQAEAGAPEGFENAIGWMVTSHPSDVQGPAPGWDVTFAVDDTDAVLAKAVELGGQILAEPVSAGPARFAVLADPQGAVLTVNSYKP